MFLVKSNLTQNMRLAPTLLIIWEWTFDAPKKQWVFWCVTEVCVCVCVCVCRTLIWCCLASSMVLRAQQWASCNRCSRLWCSLCNSANTSSDVNVFAAAHQKQICFHSLQQRQTIWQSVPVTRRQETHLMASSHFYYVMWLVKIRLFPIMLWAGAHVVGMSWVQTDRHFKGLIEGFHNPIKSLSTAALHQTAHAGCFCSQHPPLANGHD